MSNSQSFDDTLIAAIMMEKKRGREKFGEYSSQHEAYAVIKEELDELWESVKSDERLEACKEAIQVSATTMRFVEEFGETMQLFDEDEINDFSWLSIDHPYIFVPGYGLMPRVPNDDHRLCYVSGKFAWFTSGCIHDVRGDDWDDAPYEDNASRPYSWKLRMDCEPYTLIQVPFVFPNWQEARYAYSESMSVYDINADYHPWFAREEWHDGDFHIVDTIESGTTLKEFRKKVEADGGALGKIELIP